LKTSQKNKRQISILSPLLLPEKELSSLYKKVKKKKSRLLTLVILPDRNFPPYLNTLKSRIQNAGGGLRIIWLRDIQSSTSGLVRAIQESEEYQKSREVLILAPEDWHRTDIQGFMEELRLTSDGNQEFKPSRLSIRLKLLSITGLIVSLALAAMIGMASYLFRNHSETLIQGYNLSLARLVAESLEKDIQGIQYRSLALLDRLDSEKPTLSTDPIQKPDSEEEKPRDASGDQDTSDTRKPSEADSSENTEQTTTSESEAIVEKTEQTSNSENEANVERADKESETEKDAGEISLSPGHRGYTSVDQFFKENDRYLYLSSIDAESTDAKDRSIDINREFFNGPFFLEYGLKPEQFRQLLKEWPANALQNGPLHLQKFQLGNVPLLGLSFPGKNGRILMYMAADDFFQSFRKARQAGIFEIHLISSDGSILISSEGGSSAQLKGHSIIQEIVKSPVNNGSRKYTNEGKEYLASFQTLEGPGLTVLSHAETSRVFEAVRRIERQNLYLMGAVLAAAFLLVFLFARTLSVPIIRLAQATGAVRRGDYAVRIHPTTRDEIGQLTYSFLQMTRGLQEREHIKDAFGKFVSPGIAEKALRGEIKLGGEKRSGTVFFSDLRNFTALSERSQPEEVVDFLNRYFSAMVDCIQATGGMVDKFIGDAIMAHWGTLDPSQTDTADAVRAALMMRKALIQLNRELEAEGSPALLSGCGINTGPVIAGQIGSEKRLEYTVIGDTVNLASRIEYLNKLFGTDILISSYSMERVRGQFDAVEMPPLRIKGKSQPETVYAILGFIDDPDRPRSLEELRTMVGIQFDEQQAKMELQRSSDQMVNKEKKK
tara:strand:+ start:10968 stop:13463 length:2496 start_codon:yes stop_codon:yes gene_type:complete